MYIRKSRRTYKGKTYTNHLLVESVQTAKGPRQRTICSLGSLEPAPAEDWLGLAHKLHAALEGQESLSGSSTEIREWVEKARNKRRAPSDPTKTNRDRPSPLNPTRSRSNKRAKPVRCTSDSSSGASWG